MAAPILDTFTTNTPAAGTSHGWNHTIGAGSNRILIAAYHIDSDSDLITAQTFNGIAPSYTDNANDGTSRIYAAVWLSPATGTNAFSITTSSSCTLDGSSISYIDADQVQGFSLIGQIASNTQGLVSVDTPVNNCRVGSFAFNSLEVPTTIGGQTLQISDKDMALVTIDAVVATPSQVYPTFNVSSPARWQIFSFAVAEVQGTAISWQGVTVVSPGSPDVVIYSGMTPPNFQE